MNVLKLALLFCLLIPSLATAGYPDARDEYINDFADLINNSRQDDIRKKLYDIEYYSGVEITVVTIENYDQYKTGATTWEGFATGLFNYWGVGNLPSNNGVMFLISKNDRKIRIELGIGYPKHYDNIMKSIIDDHIAPQLKLGNYTEGVIVGVDQIISATTREISFLEWYKKQMFAGIAAFISLIVALIIDKKENPGLFWVLIGIAGILMIYIWRSLGTGNRSEGFGGGRSGGGGASGSF
jgi:uncharacterized protein